MGTKTVEVVNDIAHERYRQIDKCKWTPAHDDGHDNGELALAAVCYATPVLLYRHRKRADSLQFNDPWPWDQRSDARRVDQGPHAGANYAPPPEVYPPAQRRRLLVKAAALIVAEIERLDRAAAREGGGP